VPDVFGLPRRESLPRRHSGHAVAAQVLRSAILVCGSQVRRNARRGDAVETVERAFYERQNMLQRPVFEWMARIGDAARGKTGLAGG
jgi:hypothetical protein